MVRYTALHMRCHFFQCIYNAHPTHIQRISNALPTLYITLDIALDMHFFSLLYENVEDLGPPSFFGSRLENAFFDPFHAFPTPFLLWRFFLSARPQRTLIQRWIGVLTPFQRSGTLFQRWLTRLQKI
jgi:hypothetical protein